MKTLVKKSVFAIVVLAFFSLGLKLDKGAGYTKLVGPTNIYLYDSLMILSDTTTGIHIYSIKNEAAPRFLQRIPLGGNTGIAMKGNILYANTFQSIYALKITSDSTYEIAAKIKDSPLYPLGGMSMEDHSGFGCASPSSVANPMSGSVSEGGSYSVFAVIDTFLYYLNNSSIVTMSISKPDSPVKLSEISVDWSVETLFPTEKYLFVGSTSGMYILDRSIGSNPVQIGMVKHFRAYDPVVVQDTMAYVTLRNNWQWGVMRDELLMVNIAHPENADTISSTMISMPYGLAVSDTFLYVAQGKIGFSLFTVKDPRNVTAIKTWDKPAAKDFIWQGNRLYVMGFSNVSIYNVSDPLNPILISTIE